MSSNDADGIANSVDPDQTGSALFAQMYLSENLGYILPAKKLHLQDY